MTREILAGDVVAHPTDYAHCALVVASPGQSDTSEHVTWLFKGRVQTMLVTVSSIYVVWTGHRR